jgi:hypothetical protein
MNRWISIGGGIPLFIFLAALLFGQALDYPWVFDDRIYLVGNPYLRDWSEFGKLFTHFHEAATGAARFGVDGDVSTNLVLRPLTYLTFQINRHFGGFDPAGYRFFNICIHCCNAGLVALLLYKVLNSPRWGSIVPMPFREVAAWVAGAIFLIHPLQIESVTYVIQRATSLCALFYLLCVLFHLEQRGHEQSSVWRAWIASGSGLAAMLCKESGVTVPVVAILLSQQAFGGRFRDEFWRARRLLVWLPVIPALLVAVSCLQRGSFQLSSIWSVASADKSPSYVWKYAATQLEVWWRYWGMFVWPSGLCIDPALQPVAGITSGRFWISLIAWFAVVAGLGWAIRRSSLRPIAGVISASLAWFWLVIAPDSSVIPLPDLMADHRTYLPLVGCSAMVGVLVARSLRNTSPWKAGILPVMALAALAVTTHRSQQKWRTQFTLWEDACRKNPSNLRAWINLGSVALEAGDSDQAVAAFSRSLAIRPTSVALGNLAVAEIKAGRFQRAVEYAHRGLQCPSTGYDYFILGVLGEAYVRLERWSDAVAPLEAAYQRGSAYAPVVWLLANAYVKTSQHDKARSILRQGLRDHPELRPFRELLNQIDAFHALPLRQGSESPGDPPFSEVRLQLGIQ